MEQLVKDLIFGTLLGDANLQTESGGSRWRYRALHKDEHREYLYHKYEILKSLCSSQPAFNETLPDERTRKSYKRYYFNTKQDDSLKFFGDMFYKQDPVTNKWVKDVPLNVEKFLTPRALAYLYMDDGALKWKGRSNAMRICTESFSREGVLRLQKALHRLYHVKTSLSRKRLKGNTIGYRIEIPEKSSTNFREVIRPFLVNCMKYKVSDGNRGHL